MNDGKLNESAARKIALPYGMLSRIVESILDTVEAQEIYVFGSYAREEQNDDSDLDLYIVSQDDSSRFDQMARIGRALLWMGMPKDVIVSSRERFDDRARDIGSVETVVKQEGVLLYSIV